MGTDYEVTELERRAEVACAGDPARVAAVRRLIGQFHRRDGHCTMLKLIASVEGGAPQLPFPPANKTSGGGQAAGGEVGQR